MDLFINVATAGKTIIFFDQEKILFEKTWIETGKESKYVLPTISDFAAQYSGNFNKDLQNIIVVNGPGSFTGIRVAVCVVNTLLFIYPHITAYQLTVGKFFASIGTADSYLFQIYESDTFVFDINGLFTERLHTKEIAQKLGGKNIAGEILPSTLELLQEENIGFKTIKYESPTHQQLEEVKNYAQKVDHISPFYGKGANITSPKKI